MTQNPSGFAHFDKKRIQEIRWRVKNHLYYDALAEEDLALLLKTIAYQRTHQTGLIKTLLKCRMSIENMPPPPWKRKDGLEEPD